MKCAYCKEVLKEGCLFCPSCGKDIQIVPDYNEFDEQMVKWLEELKAYIEIGTVEECRNSVLDIPKAYNKAIDDFVKELKNHYTEYNIDCVLEDANFYSYTTACNYLEDYIDEIAEHLKAGGKNGTDNQ